MGYWNFAMSSSHQIDLKPVKRQAHRLAKQNDISKGEALELIAKQNDFHSWQQYRTHILNNGIQSKERVHLTQFNPSIHSKNQIRGLYPHENRAQVRISFLAPFDEKFETIVELRSYFDFHFKDIISNSKDHTFIFILLNLDFNKDYPFADEEGFFNSLLEQYPKITNMQIRYSSRAPSIEEFQSWHDETQGLIELFLRSLK